jgi:hypothetical protein
MPHPRAARTAYAVQFRNGTSIFSLPQAAGIEKRKREKAVSFFTTAANAVQKQENFVRFVKNVPCVLYFVISALYNRTNGVCARFAYAANQETQSALSGMPRA